MAGREEDGDGKGRGGKGKNIVGDKKGNEDVDRGRTKTAKTGGGGGKVLPTLTQAWKINEKKRRWRHIHLDIVSTNTQP